MLYVDQPIGVGFSSETGFSGHVSGNYSCIGNVNSSCHLTGVSNGSIYVDSTLTAAPAVWTLLQAFYAQFPQYENRDFGLFTESYGGHYGPGECSRKLLLSLGQH